MVFVVFASSTAGVSETGLLTTTALIVIAVLAAIVIVGMLYGIRQKRIRAAAEKEEKQRGADLAAPREASAASELPTSEPAARLPEPTPPPAPIEPTIKAAPRPTAEPKPAPEPEPEPKSNLKPAPPTTAEPKSRPAELVAAPEPVESAPTITEAAPAPEAAPAFALTDVKGLGPKAVPLLAGHGVTDIATLAALAPDRAAEIDGQLGALSGRLTRDRWVEQAKLLATGDVATFEATYGKL